MNISNYIYGFFSHFAGISKSVLDKVNEANGRSKKTYAGIGLFVILITLAAFAEGAWLGSHFSESWVAIILTSIFWGLFVFATEWTMMVSMVKTGKNGTGGKLFFIRLAFSLSVSIVMVTLALLFLFREEINQNIAQTQESLKVSKTESYKDVETRYDGRMETLVKEQNDLMSKTPNYILEIKNNIAENETKQKSVTQKLNSLVAQRRNIRNKDSVSTNDQSRDNWLTRQIISEQSELNKLKSSTAELEKSLYESEKRHNEFIANRSKQVKEELGNLHSEKSSTIDENRSGREKLFAAINANDKLYAELLQLYKILSSSKDKNFNILLALGVLIAWVSIQLTPVALKLSMNKTAVDRFIEKDELEKEIKYQQEIDALNHIKQDEDYTTSLRMSLQSKMRNEFINNLEQEMNSETKRFVDKTEMDKENFIKFFEKKKKLLVELEKESNPKIREKSIASFWAFFEKEAEEFDEVILNGKKYSYKKEAKSNKTAST